MWDTASYAMCDLVKSGVSTHQEQGFGEIAILHATIASCLNQRDRQRCFLDVSAPHGRSEG